jgi:hypothetical protein
MMDNKDLSCRDLWGRLSDIGAHLTQGGVFCWWSWREEDHCSFRPGVVVFGSDFLFGVRVHYSCAV